MNWTIGKKLFGGFGVILLLLFIMVYIGLHQINNLNESYRFLINDKAQKATDIKDLQVTVKQEIVSMRGLLIVGDESAYKEYKEARKHFQKDYNNLQKRFTIPEAKQMLTKLNQIEQEYNTFAQKVFDLRKQNKVEEVSTTVALQGRDIVHRFDDQIKKLSSFQKDIVDQGVKENIQTFYHIQAQLLIIGLIAFVLGIFISLIIGRQISKPIKAISASAKKIANGDLKLENIQVKSKDETGILAQAFNQMTSNLKVLIGQVKANSELIASSSEELSASAEQTTEATNQIATSIQEVASGAETQRQGAYESAQAMKEMAVGVQQVAETTSSVAELTMETNKEANNGHESLKKVINQMDTIHTVVNNSASVVQELGGHSKEIGNIIAVITSIADQTNLLALNATIEAARAGEHGRGFAVVADEVRNLAEQSKQSADQITSLIEKIQNDTNSAVAVMNQGTEEVKIGMNVVYEAEKGFNKILQLVEQVTSQIQEASAASEEMSASVEEVYASIEEISRIAKDSANYSQSVAASSEEQLATMEEIASSATSLSKIAVDLQEQVSQFKI